MEEGKGKLWWRRGRGGRLRVVVGVEWELSKAVFFEVRGRCVKSEHHPTGTTLKVAPTTIGGHHFL